MHKTKRPLSFLLAVVMIVSMFAVVPFTASAEDKVIGENVIFKLGDTIVLPGNGIYIKRNKYEGAREVHVNGTVTRFESDGYQYSLEIEEWGVYTYLNTFDYWEEMEQGLSVLGITFSGSGTESDPYMPKLALGEVESTWAGEGEGTEASPWLIKDLNDLRTLSANVASGMTYSGKYLKLTTDIDCGSDNWETIGGADAKMFSGTFDGDGKTITYSIICSEDDAPKGLFAKIGSAGTVKNLNVAGSIVNTAEYAGPAGGIAAYNSGLIENCYSAVDINKGCDRGTGGIAAHNDEGATIRYCAASGTLTWTDASDFSALIGGITGENYNYNDEESEIKIKYVTNCAMLGDVLAQNATDQYNYAGRLIGRQYDATTSDECYYLDTMTVTGVVNSDSVTAKTAEELKAIGQAAIDAGYTVYGLALGGSLSNPDQDTNDRQFVTVDDQISITLSLDLGPRGVEPDAVSITLAGNAYDAQAVAAGTEGVYNYKIEMAPAQMNDEIVVTIEGDADPLTTSVKAYCDSLSASSAADADDKALALAMLHYGQAAKNVFGYTGATIATLDAMDKDAVQTASATFTDGTGAVTGASFMALTKPEFRFYTNGITEQQGYDYNQAGVTAAMEGGSDALTARFVKKADGKVLLEVKGISAENMDKVVTVTVTGLGSITFNGNAFAKAMAKSGDTAQKNLGAALYNYGAAAKVCFAAGQETPVVEEEGVDLSTLDGDYEAQDGDVLTGTLSGNKKITIANGATITLKDVNITSLENDSENASYAGITPLGDATIVLKGTNTVRGGYEDYPGIYAPENKTLTIGGNGSLVAYTHATADNNGGYGCGIGGGYKISAGNIVINGGTITATGGNAAAIGCGDLANCGNITITGGTIIANGGNGSAGIGSGFTDGYGCGDILIKNTVTQVTATKGFNARDSIGRGKDGTCGTVTIEDGANVTQN